MNRGDVVIARYPFSGGVGSKVRPAVVIQCDRLNRRLHDTLLALVTSKIALVGREPSQFLIDPGTPEGATSGLSHPSAVKCASIMTVPQVDIIDVIGHLSDALMQKLDACLREAFEL